VLLAVLLFLFAGYGGTAIAQSPPTPTPPSLERPNLHIYLKDGSGTPLAGIKLNLYDGKPNLTTGAFEIKKLLEGVTDATLGKAAFDVTGLPRGFYYLEMLEADGALILNTDPDGPPLGTGGVAPEAVRHMSGLQLTKGSVVYVNNYRLNPLIKPSGEPGKPRRAVYEPSTTYYTYIPPNGSSLSALPTITPTLPISSIAPSSTGSPQATQTGRAGLTQTTTVGAGTTPRAVQTGATGTPQNTNNSNPAVTNSISAVSSSTASSSGSSTNSSNTGLGGVNAVLTGGTPAATLVAGSDQNNTPVLSSNQPQPVRPDYSATEIVLDYVRQTATAAVNTAKTPTASSGSRQTNAQLGVTPVLGAATEPAKSGIPTVLSTPTPNPIGAPKAEDDYGSAFLLWFCFVIAALIILVGAFAFVRNFVRK
jgi:hypothetical protein